jgi:ankyrin repeat protein
LLVPEICREPEEFFIERKFIAEYRQRAPEYSTAAARWPSHAAEFWDDIHPLVSELFAIPRTFNFVQWMLEYARQTLPGQYGSKAGFYDDILDLTDALCDGTVSPLHAAAAFGFESIAHNLITKVDDTNKSGPFGCPLLCALCGPEIFRREFNQARLWIDIDARQNNRAILHAILQADAKVPKPYSHMSTQWEPLIAFGFRASLTSGDRSYIQSIIRGGVDIHHLHTFLGSDELASLPVEYLPNVSPVLSGILDLVLVSSTLGLGEEDRQDTIGRLADAFNVMKASHTRENLDLTDAEFEEALQDAMIEDNVLCFSRLIPDARFDANSASRTTTSSGTLVHSAVCDNLLDITDMLADAGGSLDTRDNKGRTPLLVCNSRDMLSVLVHQHGASTKAVDHEGRSIWHYVAATADLPLLMWLVAQDPFKKENMSVRNHGGYTPLDEAFRYGLSSIETNDNRTDLGTQNTALAIQLLLVNGAKYSGIINGLPITHVAAIWGMPKIVETLAANDADFGTTDSQGRSALHHITLLASVEHVKALQRLCASTPILDNDGNSPAESIFLSTAVRGSDGRVKRNAYPFLFSDAVYDRLLQPQVLSSRDAQGRTLWERFCGKVLPSIFDCGDPGENVNLLQDKWNMGVFEALLRLRRHGAHHEYQEATGKPAMAALELGIGPHNYQWAFNYFVLKSCVDDCDPQALQTYFSTSPATARYLVAAVLRDVKDAIIFLIDRGVAVHVPHEKLNGTVLEHAISHGKSDLVSICLARIGRIALNSRREEICRLLESPDRSQFAESFLLRLIDSGFAPQLAESGSQDAEAMLSLVSRMMENNPSSNILSQLHARGLNVESLDYDVSAAEAASAAENTPPPRRATVLGTITPTATTNVQNMLRRLPPAIAARVLRRQPPPAGTTLNEAQRARLRRHRALGRGPLHIAVLQRHGHILRYLLDLGTQDIMDNEGRTARAIAIEEEYDDIVRIFEEHDAERANSARAT